MISKENIFPEYAFKRGVVLYNRLYKKWEKEIDEYSIFLQETKSSYKKQGFHYEI